MKKNIKVLRQYADFSGRGNGIINFKTLKKVFFLLVLLQLSLVSASQTEKPVPEKKSPSASEMLRDKHGYAESSLAYMILKSDAGDKIHNIGIKLGFGFYPFADFIRLGIETGVHTSVNRMPIGTFDYTESGRSYTDGIVKRKMLFIPLLINGSFEFGTETMFRIGPTAGIMALFAGNAFEPNIKNADFDDVAIQSKAPFVYGVHAEASFSISEILKFNLGYKYLKLTSFTLANKNNWAFNYDVPATGMKLAGHQISIGFLFAF